MIPDPRDDNFSGVEEQNVYDGKRKVTFKDGRPVMSEYSSTDQKFIERYALDPLDNTDQKHGLQEYFYPETNLLHRTENFEFGNKKGTQREFSKEGKLLFCQNYEIIDGVSTLIGTLRSNTHGNFSAIQCDPDPKKCVDPDLCGFGIPKIHKLYTHENELMSEVMYLNGKLIDETIYPEHLEFIEFNKFHESSPENLLKIKFTKVSDDLKLVTEYFPNEKVRRKYFMSNDRRIKGIDQKWFDDGQLRSLIEYSNEGSILHKTLFWQNGRKRNEVFTNGTSLKAKSYDDLEKVKLECDLKLEISLGDLNTLVDGSEKYLHVRTAERFKADGIWKEWTTDSEEVRVDLVFKKGVMNGTVTFESNNEQIVQRYQDGKVISKEIKKDNIIVEQKFNNDGSRKI